jgi:hypothetical protein
VRAVDPFKPYQPKPKTSVPLELTVEVAEAIALKAVAFIAGNDTLLSRFLAITGCGPDDLRTRIAERAFLGAVLDFILADEPTVLHFTTAADLAPELPMLARRKLP